MSLHAPGIPMEGLVPADKLSAPGTHSTTALRSYIPALDGVRGLAILTVMCCHFVWFAPEIASFPIPDKLTALGVEAMKTGRYGVDLFFVLSGFLITGILYDAKNEKHYFRNFYARRTLRIFPLYYTVLLIMFVILPIFVSFNRPGEREIIHNQGWMWLYMTNIKEAFSSPELFQQNRLWLGHFWSLAIEEQFYLVWPMVILLLSRRQAMTACTAMIIGAALLRVAMFVVLPQPQGLYCVIYFTLCKLDTLALGAILALAARSPRGITSYAKFAPWIFVLSLMLLAPLLFPRFKPEKIGWTGGLAESAKLSGICLLSGSVLVMAVHSTAKNFIGWFFMLPVMRFFGKYSYGIYIFHELFAPLFNGKLSAETISRHLGVGNWYLATLIHIAVAFAVSVGVALISWNVLEKHMLKLKRYFEHGPQTRQQRAAPAASAGMTLPADALRTHT